MAKTQQKTKEEKDPKEAMRYLIGGSGATLMCTSADLNTGAISTELALKRVRRVVKKLQTITGPAAA